MNEPFVTNEFRETKAKIISLANRKRHGPSSQPVKTRSSCVPDAKRGKMFARESRFVMASFSDWMTKWRELFKPMAHRTYAKPKQTLIQPRSQGPLSTLGARLTLITFDIQVKTALNKHSQDYFSIGNQSSSVFVVDFATGYGFSRR